jgi:heat shock protein HslJ
MDMTWRDDAPAIHDGGLTMPIRSSALARVVLFAAATSAALMLLSSAAAAATALATYRGEATGSTGPGRKIELRLKADGTLSLMTDLRNNRAPVIEEGRWNAVSVEEIDLVIERRDGIAVSPETLHFVRNGNVLQAAAQSAARFGSQELQLRQVNTAAAVVSAPVAAGPNPDGAWHWESLVTSAEKIAVEQPERYTLDLQAGGKAQVRADCNRGQASYKVQGRAITIRLAGMTRAACASGSMSARYLKALESATGQRIKGNSLFLDLPGEGGTMVFVRAR